MQKSRIAKLRVTRGERQRGSVWAQRYATPAPGVRSTDLSGDVWRAATKPRPWATPIRTPMHISVTRRAYTTRLSTKARKKR